MTPQEETAARVRLHDLHPPADDLCADVAQGLGGPERRLPPKYFYDDRGARLFERITELEAYYPTRTELGILHRAMPEIAAAIGSGARIIEFGSGSGEKTHILLDGLMSPAAYLPIDISRAQLVEFAERTQQEYPDLEVLPVCADYTRELTLPASTRSSARTVAFFPGSTIGNLSRGDAESFLQRVRELCGEDGKLLIGVDLEKDRAVLERAYNDPEGVTAEFNLNLLRRINQECGADFELDGFRHLAVYDEAEGRIEMRLVSRRHQRVHLPAHAGGDARTLEFAEGGYIVTEHSHKYSIASFGALAARAGWAVEHCWTDERGWFGVFLLEGAVRSA